MLHLSDVIKGPLPVSDEPYHRNSSIPIMASQLKWAAWGPEDKLGPLGQFLLGTVSGIKKEKLATITKVADVQNHWNYLTENQKDMFQHFLSVKHEVSLNRRSLILKENKNVLVAVAPMALQASNTTQCCYWPGTVNMLSRVFHSEQQRGRVTQWCYDPRINAFI